MGGKLTKLDRIIKSIRIIKKINNEYRYDVESMLYAFADKFLDGKDLEKVKEEISNRLQKSRVTIHPALQLNMLIAIFNYIFEANISCIKVSTIYYNKC